ncbi:MAG: hypothetical protein J5379_09890 [Clostridiales bacterium]|nr:hypothetical protein [Clostridiales bacterium]
MKRISSLVLVLVMAAALTACSDTNTVGSKASGSSAATTAAQGESQTQESQNDGEGSVDVTLDTKDNFVFKAQDTDILLGGDPTAVLEKLGEPKSKLDVPSCAHDGTDHVYTYSDFSLTVYTETGSETGFISDVLLTSDLVATPEGLEIGMSADKTREIYGDADKETDTLWIYKRGTSQLMVTFNAGKVISIEYQIP